MPSFKALLLLFGPVVDLAMPYISVSATSAAAAAASHICLDCVESYTEGIDAGAYKDIEIAGCAEGGSTGSPCFCDKPESPCWDAAVGAKMAAGSPEHQAACCGLCSVTTGAGCLQPHFLS